MFESVREVRFRPKTDLELRLHVGHGRRHGVQIPSDVLSYYRSGAPLVRNIPSQELDCEFYEEEVVLRYNLEYEVPEYAPGYFMFATNGCGELIALSLVGSVVRMPFIGLGPRMPGSWLRHLASSWSYWLHVIRSASDPQQTCHQPSDRRDLCTMLPNSFSP